ncbi:MAG: hypothetical protein WB985_10625 [Candidatus Acidiferrales bacterium]
MIRHDHGFVQCVSVELGGAPLDYRCDGLRNSRIRQPSWAMALIIEIIFHRRELSPIPALGQQFKTPRCESWDRPEQAPRDEDCEARRKAVWEVTAVYPFFRDCWKYHSWAVRAIRKATDPASQQFP